MSTFFKLLVSLAAISGFTRAAFACEACALYIAEGDAHPGFTLSVAHQFTRLGTVWQGDRQVGNPVRQYLESDITQVAVSYSRGGPWLVQLTVPTIRRAYLRPNHALIERDTVRGLGDTTLSARYQVWRKITSAGTGELNLLGGVEFATGDDALLASAASHHFHHHTGVPDSGIHAHDLALGSGSTDWLAGTDGRWERGRLFVRGQFQYQLRQTGAFQYRFANETSWEIGVGGYAVRTDERTFTVQGLFLAERKGLDTVAGAPQIDTGANLRYVGGRVTGTWGKRLEAAFSVEVPVRIRTTETMIVPDYRLRSALTWHF